MSTTEEENTPDLVPECGATISNFNAIFQRDVNYVDKSLDMVTVLDNQDRWIMLSCPSGFGKSSLISMIYNFVKVEDNTSLFEKMKIREKKDFYVKHYSQHPVLFLEFSDVKPNNLLKGKKAILKKVTNALGLLNRNEELEEIIKKIEEVGQNLKNTKNEKDMSLEIIQEIFICDLVPLLEREQSKKNALVLIDDIDIPILHLQEVEKEDEEWKSLSMFIYSIFNVFRILDRKMISTCEIDVFDTKENCNLFSKTLMNDLFGFSETELKELIRKSYGKKYHEVIMERMKIWYDGYLFGNKDMDAEQVFHPYSVVKYLNKCINDHKLYKGECYLKVPKILENLIQNVPIEILKNIVNMTILPKSGDFRFVDLTMKVSKKEFQKGYRKDPKFILPILYNLGLLSRFKESNEIYRFYIPNKSAQTILSEELRELLLEQSEEDIDFSEIEIEREKDFVEKVSCFINEVISKFPTKNEANFNALSYMRYGLSKKRTHIPFIELNGGFGRVDNIFLPHKKAYHSAGIHEYKFCSKEVRETQKNEKLELGQWQILSKNYSQIVLDKNNKINDIQQVIIRTILFITNDESVSLNLDDEDSYGQQFERNEFNFNPSGWRAEKKVLVESTEFILSIASVKKVCLFFKCKTLEKILNSAPLKNNILYLSNFLKEKTKTENIADFVDKISKIKEDKIETFAEELCLSYFEPRGETFNFYSLERSRPDLFMPISSYLIEKNKNVFNLTENELIDLGFSKKKVLEFKKVLDSALVNKKYWNKEFYEQRNLFTEESQKRLRLSFSGNKTERMKEKKSQKKKSQKKKENAKKLMKKEEESFEIDDEEL